MELCFTMWLVFLGVFWATVSESPCASALYLLSFILPAMLCPGTWILCSSTGTVVCCSDGLESVFYLVSSCGANVHSLISLFSLSLTSFFAFSSCC